MKLRIYLILFLLLLCLLLPGSIFAAEILYFVHQDHLGSTVLTTDSTGKKASKQVYYPFGETRSADSNLTTKRQYTGQVSDTDETGLYYYNARYYNPTIGKFTQADTASDGTNRYAYVRNNPLRFTDPSGNIDWDMLGEEKPKEKNWTPPYYLKDIIDKLNLLPFNLSLTDDLSLTDSPDDLDLLNKAEAKAKAKTDILDTNPLMITPQSSVSVDLDPGGVNGSKTFIITIKVIPNSEMNVAIDPFMKIILPSGMQKTSSFSSNQAGWGQIYYDETNTFVIDNYNISFGNNFELSFQVDVSRKSLSGIIRIETWSDLYNFDGSHDQIRQTVDKIPLSKKNN
ncbi:hypothetical protein A3J20_03390 [Candidatus Gottesmanbacteria bacterium RIFCSPLOWO2_02_FULL_42_29]|uniref:Teneurin-like YD-shell domain-containing protein n=2 Tax=Candidatus Gottesmaniibacteriota TaxID=1752720 RepID=A0A1F6BDP1_9BACT|nr:MAG: YD repeat protein [Candidatus Gottesmanbacteria bacterium GW2011_GWA2_42_18]KKS75658.1 MAG: YD repeat protein [Candidatus Gottesmanbacteria bacterium GW2011_GWC2_42_8]OGG12220.1 MAG: hypothetical protein A2781_04875 [Candidatus Gottesmanbacteria bacterium RIFCSPHIGHO2_01_FULL_42_27]OGG21708.1 MAG: hypothetical protein A3E72_04540 [Candidatus Gottesmanbacteria bacterium RIFCSPHIGHO2_12_FULL_43_26]OGG34247.1 MAG: hypothetical protein A3G68_03005 [Candidatus Gottesmanbacteria bacterium RIF